MLNQGSWNETGTKFVYIPDVIFVFGSNLAGRHGKGAALFARIHYGAVYGVGWGWTGNAWAIPTKDWNLRTLPLESIKPWIEKFKIQAAAHPKTKFLLTRIGCGLAGYTDADIAPMFRGIGPNVVPPKEWEPYLA